MLKKIIVRSFSYYKKQHLALVLGAFISTAIISGALIVGDSVRHSLKSMVDARLGHAEFALQTGERFVRKTLSEDLKNNSKLALDATSVFITEGLSISPEHKTEIPNTQFIGIDDSFWSFSGISLSAPQKGEAYLSENTARALGISKNETLLIRVKKRNQIPLNTPFVEDEASIAMRLKITAVLSEKELGRFSLKTDQKSVYNLFLNYDELTEKLDLKGLTNLILAKGKQLNAEKIQKILKQNMQLEDIAIKLSVLNDLKEIELVSDRIFIPDTLVNLIDKIIPLNYKYSTYLINKLKNNTGFTPYSFVSAIDQRKQKLAKNELLISQWLAKDRNLEPGDSLSLHFYRFGKFKELVNDSSWFIVKSIYDHKNSYFDGRLMPPFPGITDADNCRDWDAGIPIDLNWIREKDEEYWNYYKGSPKALISLQNAKQLWANEYGFYTSIRFKSEEITQIEIEKRILMAIQPDMFNLKFKNLRKQGIRAADNSVDFGGLFLSLSFFVIAAGFLLTVLMYKLSIDGRKKEAGLLLALGYSNQLVIWYRILETLIPLAIGSLLGVFGGILYNQIVIEALNSVWQGAVHTNLLLIKIQPDKLLIGGLSGILINTIAVFVLTKNQLKSNLIQLIKQQHSESNSKKRRSSLSSKQTLLTTSAISIGLIVAGFFGSESKSSAVFLSAGAFSMLSLILLYLRYLSVNRSKLNFTITTLSQKNLRRNSSRSVSTIALIALGTFTIIITGANRKSFIGLESNRASGTGGYKFWAETSIPLLYNLNNPLGKQKYELLDELSATNTSFLQFKVLEGDDASCLNLNQVQQPKVLGINPQVFHERQSFSFKKLEKQIDKEKAWLYLENKLGPNTYPAYADQTVIDWGLIKRIGDTLFYEGEQGEQVKFILAGGLESSIFQGNLLISESVFTKHFPSISGSKVMLIDAIEKDTSELAKTLKNTLRDYGIELYPTSERLANFYTVTNTYLSVFMILGGLGMLIGTFGLGILIFRNVIERKNELAILQALGFSRQKIRKMVLKENIYLLSWGLFIGFISAIIGILPGMINSFSNIPIPYLSGLMILLFFNGLLWIYISTNHSLKGNLLNNLREE